MYTIPIHILSLTVYNNLTLRLVPMNMINFPLKLITLILKNPNYQIYVKLTPPATVAGIFISAW